MNELVLRLPKLTRRWLGLVNWLLIIVCLLSQRVPKQTALGLFVVLRVSAIFLAVVYVVEMSMRGRARLSASGLVLDGLVVTSMFAFWFVVRAATL